MMKGTLLFTFTLVLLLGVAGFLTTGFAQTYVPHKTLLETDEGFKALAFSPDGTLLASGGFGGADNIYLHNPETGRLLHTLRGHTDSVNEVAFSPDGALLASVSRDDTVKLWNPQTGRLVQTLEGHQSSVLSVAFSPTGTLITGDASGKMFRWTPAEPGEHRLVYRGNGHGVTTAVYSSTGDLAIGRGIRNQKLGVEWFGIVVWGPGEVPQDPDRVAAALHIDQEDWVQRVTFAATGELVSGSSDGTVRIFPPYSIHASKILRGHTDTVYWVDVSASGTIASASRDGTVRLWNLATGQHVATLAEHTASVNTVAFSPNEKWLASGSRDGTVRLWQRSGVAPVVDDSPIRIPDANLAAVIRETLQLGEGAPITGAAMRELTELKAIERGIADLTGLEYAINLRSLDLSGRPGTNLIEDISALANLTQLKDLELSWTGVSDFSALARFTNLETLFLRGNDISDISALANLTKLKGLGLDNTDVSDISALANFTQLEWLFLDYTDVSDISALANLTKLKTLFLNGCPLNHAALLTHIPALLAKGIKVDFDKKLQTRAQEKLAQAREGKAPSDIHIPDADLANVLHVVLQLGEGTPITAAAMRELTALTISQEIADLTGLEYAINLRSLSLSGWPRTNPIEDISALANLTNLRELNLSYTDVSDVSALANLTQLEKLYLGFTDVSDISALANLTNLEELYLSYTNVSDVSALAHLTNLEELNLTGNNVSDVSPLANLTNLERLSLRETDVQDISPLVNLPNLGVLNLLRCRLSRAAGHTHIPALQARGTKVYFNAGDIPRGCGTLIPANLKRLEPVRTKPITQKQQIVSEGNFQGGTVKFAPQVNNGESRAWTYPQTVFGRKYPEHRGWKLDTVVLTAKILNGTAKEKAMIKRAAAAWERNGNLFFRFVESGEADVQISIRDGEKGIAGKASLGATEGAYIKLSPDFTYGTCLHEFGHVLGLMHEHLSPRFLDLVEWAYEGEALYAALRHDGFNMSDEDLRNNILTPREVGPAAKFDPDSIMTYGFSAHLFKARPDAPNPTLANEIATKGVPDNSVLSADDKGLLRHIYGPPGQRVLVEGSISIDGVDDETGKVKWKPIKVFGRTVGWRPAGWKDDETINESESFGPQLFTSIDEYVLASGRDPAEPRNPDARFEWGDECRVEVYLSTREIVEGSHIEMAASAFLFEGDSVYTTDLEDFRCKDFDVPLNGLKRIWTLKLENKFWRDNDRPLLAIDTRARQCRKIDIGVTQSWLALGGDVLGGGDWAEIAISLSAKPVDSYTELLAAAKAAAAPAAATVKHRPSQEISDVNGDGQVTVADLVLVSNHIGQTNPSDSRVDLNDDGIVTIVDLVHVAQHLGQSTDPAAPAHIVAPRGLAYETVEGWLNRARAADDGSRPFRQGITNLERLLVLIIPEKTALLHNYPNPFNPETWIPYHLAEAAEVTLTIYSVDGTVVRTLALGHQSAGFYQSRSRAAYWDGRNEVGERVASGVYFYTLTAGDLKATRKMVIRK